MKVLIFGIVTLLVLVVSGSRSQERPQVLCGRHLADARLLYCFGVVNTPQKRFNIIGANQIIGMSNVEPGDRDAWALRRSRFMMRALSQASRAKRIPGLVDECCYKPCYVSELLNYC